MSNPASFLSPLVERFISYRKASENWCDFYEYMIWRFERYCADSYPEADVLTQEMVNSWCKQLDTENNNSCRSRIYAVVNMVRYLRAREETDVSPPDIPQRIPITYIPHAFTEREIRDFFNACDSLPSTPNKLTIHSRKITIPVFFRLLYSSGIRTNEARMLRVVDVDLLHGILDIQKSKGQNQHYVVLHDSMLALMRQYNDAIGKLYPNRTYFFPATKDKYHKAPWLVQNFNQMWSRVSNSHATAYAFRHHYAVSNINGWIGEGFEFDDKLMYLSKSMGHRDIESTRYYYSLVPGFADILEEQTNVDFEDIVPEVDL
jgi:integrase